MTGQHYCYLGGIRFAFRGVELDLGGKVTRFISLIILIVGFASQTWASKNIWGTHNGTKYDIYLSEITDNIWGKYGDKNIDFYVKKSTENIWGEGLDGPFDIYVKKSTENIWGKHPCGNLDYYAKKSTKNVWGTYCGDSFDEYFSNEQETIEDATWRFLSLVLFDLPDDHYYEVYYFIYNRLPLLQ